MSKTLADMLRKKMRNEPDMTYITLADGRKGLIRRSVEEGKFHLCGYLIVDDGDDILTNKPHQDSLPVHGGVTFAGKLDTGESAIGFECCHEDDLYDEEHLYCDEQTLSTKTYKDVSFVTYELGRLSTSLLLLYRPVSTLGAYHIGELSTLRYNHYQRTLLYGNNIEVISNIKT